MTTKVYAVAGSPFVIEATPANNGVYQVTVTARDSYNFSPAGFLATLNEAYTYLNTSSGAKATSVSRALSRGLMNVNVDTSSASYPVLSADVAGEVAALTTILQTVADVTT